MELSRSSSSKKANIMPMKTLVAQEMSKEVQYKSPNVIAKLMGLDNLPQQQPTLVAQRKHLKSSRSSLSHSRAQMERWEQEHSFPGKQMLHELPPRLVEHEYRNSYQTRERSQKETMVDFRPQKGQHNDYINQQKMALIRQKFMEAKHLSSFEKGSRSKEFQDTLEILSSNENMLLKFLQGSNYMFSHNLHHMKPSPPTSETNRITVLKPSNIIVDEKFRPPVKTNKETKGRGHKYGATGWDKSKFERPPTVTNRRVDECPSPSTRIVVLKPSPGRIHDAEAMASPSSVQQKTLFAEDFYNQADAAKESREMANEIICQMRLGLMVQRNDEVLPASLLPNGYIGDDGSFIKSEIEEVVENIWDSAIMSPSSRHSWDYISSFESPPRSSSLSRRSCSPESSVCREAKKHLSERLALINANGHSREKTKARRSSSTLGEMLALLDAQSSMKPVEKTTNTEKEPTTSTSCSAGDSNRASVTDLPERLQRSKSLSLSSSMYDSRVVSEALKPESTSVRVPKNPTKTKNTKSVRVKVSSLFLSKNKRLNIENSGEIQSRKEPHSAFPEAPECNLFLQKSSEDSCYRHENSGLELYHSPGTGISSSKIAYQSFGVSSLERGSISQEGGLPVTKRLMSRISNENQDQPSPVSVLDTQFENHNAVLEIPADIKLDGQGTEAHPNANLIGKSPPIGSIARTLSWDGSREEMATICTFRRGSVSSADEEEHDWRLFIQTLLSECGFTGDVQSRSSCSRSRWHSPQSPLDPSLRDKHANQNDKNLHEAIRRERRSNSKLIFDYVNTTLMEITKSYEVNVNTKAISPDNKITEYSMSTLADQLWDQMKDWLCREVKYMYLDGDDDGDMMAVEVMVRKEMTGRWWMDNVRNESENIENEIEAQLLEELLEEALAGLMAADLMFSRI